MLTSTFCHGLPVSTPVLSPLNTSNLPSNVSTTSSPRPLPQPHAQQRNMTMNSGVSQSQQQQYTASEYPSAVLPVIPGGLKGGLVGSGGSTGVNGSGSGFDASGPVIPPTSLKMKWSSMKSTLSPLGTPVLPPLAYSSNPQTSSPLLISSAISPLNTHLSNTGVGSHGILRPDSIYAPSPSSIQYSPILSHPGSSLRSRSSSIDEFTLRPGDVLGEGVDLQGEPLRLVPGSIFAAKNFDDDEEGGGEVMGVGIAGDGVGGVKEPGREFEVVRRLGKGSYAIVYLVKEVLERREAEYDDEVEEDEEDVLSDSGASASVRSEDEWFGTRMELGVEKVKRKVKRRVAAGKDRRRAWVYGREFAVKLLSKANLDEEALKAQMTEANIHQSLPRHSNIVTLHRTMETSAYLILLLEFVPGQDLFYFLEQAKDQWHAPEPEVVDSAVSSVSIPAATSGSGSESSSSSGTNSNSNSDSIATSSTAGTPHTPPTPTLLSSSSPPHLLSPSRLRLISRMFRQMCDAVGACHDVDVFHRDIKPENFIVTEEVVLVGGGGGGGRGVRKERKVVVKLSDFGLSTNEVESADIGCGSAPYMSYECSNNCSPTYSPRAADVWSLGIVLINMLYHINPWTDASSNLSCPAFATFLTAPTQFFMSRFVGMTPAVANFLANRVFCLLDEDDQMDKHGKRISAREFGEWVERLGVWFGVEREEEIVVAVVGQSHSQAQVEDSFSDTFEPVIPNFKKGKEPVVPVLSPVIPPFARHRRGVSLSIPPSSSVLSAHGLSSISISGTATPATSIGFSLSSVPVSKRPGSRTASIGGGVGLRMYGRSPIVPSATLPPSSAIAHSHAQQHGMSMSVPSTPMLRPRGLPLGGPVVGGVGLTAARGALLEDVDAEEGESEFGFGFGYGDLQKERERDQEREHGHEFEQEHDQDQDVEQEQEQEQEQESQSRSTSVARRRKRGARKGRGAALAASAPSSATIPSMPISPMSMPMPIDSPTSGSIGLGLGMPLGMGLGTTLANLNGAAGINAGPVGVVPSKTTEALVSANQTLVRELSRSHSQSHIGLVHHHSQQQLHHHHSQQQLQPLQPLQFPAPQRSPSVASSVASSPMSPTGASVAATTVVATTSLPPVPPLMQARAAGQVSTTPVLVPKVPIVPAPTPTPPVPIVKKASKWKLSFGRSTSNAAAAAAAAAPTSMISVGSVSSGTTDGTIKDTKSFSGSISTIGSAGVTSVKSAASVAKANNVSNLVMGLNAPMAFSAGTSQASGGSGVSVSTRASGHVARSLESLGPVSVQHANARSPERGGITGVEIEPLSSTQVSESWGRGRRGRPPAVAAAGPTGTGTGTGSSSSRTIESWANGVQNGGSGGMIRPTPPAAFASIENSRRNVSPTSTRNGISQPSPNASSVMLPSSTSALKNNWRSSVSAQSMSTNASANTSTSGFTRFSNSSNRSVSTVATSVSAGSWRNQSNVSLASTNNGACVSGTGTTSTRHGGSASSGQAKKVRQDWKNMPPPKNLKIMDGVPWALDELPRGMHPKPDGDIFGHPPVRKQRIRKPKDLPTINERPAPKSPLSQRHDVYSSSPDLRRLYDGDALTTVKESVITSVVLPVVTENPSANVPRGNSGGDNTPVDDGTTPRKVHKGQITALAKMLSALKR